MTKDKYFEMCEMLGSESKEDEIPVEYEDLIEDVQYTLSVYNMLQDNWDTMNGNYLGKNMSGLTDVFNVLGVEDHRTCFFIIQIIDGVRSTLINKKTPAK